MTKHQKTLVVLDDQIKALQAENAALRADTNCSHRDAVSTESGYCPFCEARRLRERVNGMMAALKLSLRNAKSIAYMLPVEKELQVDGVSLEVWINEVEAALCGGKAD